MIAHATTALLYFLLGFFGGGGGGGGGGGTSFISATGGIGACSLIFSGGAGGTGGIAATGGTGGGGGKGFFLDCAINWALKTPATASRIIFFFINNSLPLDACQQGFHKKIPR